MPPDIPIAEVRYYPPMAEQENGHHWHTIPITVLTLEDAREKRVTVGYAGWRGDDTHYYEIDLTPTAAEELALRLIRRAHEVRAAEQAEDDA
jgi:hypothetical protein